jgi:hypothetical protein
MSSGRLLALTSGGAGRKYLAHDRSNVGYVLRVDPDIDAVGHPIAE